MQRAKGFAPDPGAERLGKPSLHSHLSRRLIVHGCTPRSDCSNGAVGSRVRAMFWFKSPSARERRFWGGTLVTALQKDTRTSICGSPPEPLSRRTPDLATLDFPTTRQTPPASLNHRGHPLKKILSMEIVPAGLETHEAGNDWIEADPVSRRFHRCDICSLCGRTNSSVQ